MPEADVFRLAPDIAQAPASHIVYIENVDNDSEKGGKWTRLMNGEFDGEPLWYIAAMAAVPFHVGLIISRLHFADVVIHWALGLMIAGGTALLLTTLCRK